MAVVLRGARLIFVLTCVLAGTATRAAADTPEEFPVRRIEDIAEPNLRRGDVKPRAEPVERVRTARVMLANYPLIRRDFPALKNASNAGIDRWLLTHTGHLASSQVASVGVNSPVQTDPQAAARRAFRPTSYGRALIFEVPGGLVEGKGFGARDPQHGDHSNGLAYLAEVIHEFQYHGLMEEVARHADVGLGVVGAYAVIDWGFDVLAEDGRATPAGAILRQAHNRALSSPGQVKSYGYNLGMPPAGRGWQVEKLLRHYGITSAGGGIRAQYPYDMVNVQMDRSGTRIVDFGAYRVYDSFPRRQVRSWIDPRAQQIHVEGDARDFVQPTARLAIPPGRWGVDPSEAWDRPWLDAQELALAVRAGTKTRADVERYVERSMAPVRRKLRAAAPVPVTERLVPLPPGPRKAALGPIRRLQESVARGARALAASAPSPASRPRARR